MSRSNRGSISLTGPVVGLGVVSALALGGWWALMDGGHQDTVDWDRLVTVEQRTVLDAVTASGRVEPLARVAVMSRASGIIKALHVEEGDRVSQDQVLAELDREQLEAQLAQDQADLASAEARVAAAKARLVEAEASLHDPALEFAERQAQRTEELFTTANVSESERDDAQQALASVQFQLDQIRNRLPALQAAIAEAEANLASSQAALDRTQTALRETTIRSPIDGIVLVRDREVGDGVSSILTAGGNATQIMSLGDLSTMFVEARVDEVDLGRIRVGMPAKVTVDAFRNQELVGQVDRIAPAGSVDDNGIVTFEVRVTVTDPNGILRPDMTADAKLVLDERTDVLTLPQRAIRRADGDAWVVDRIVGSAEDASIESVRVTLGISDGLITEVSGLQQGDRVLVPDTSLGPSRR